jgi:hypothetical protein
MKIHNDHPSAQTRATDALAPTPDQASTPGKAQNPSVLADQIRLSPEARALKAVADHAAEPPAIRQDVVDRARALLEADTLGDDPAQLANAIIDDLLTFQ